MNCKRCQAVILVDTHMEHVRDDGGWNYIRVPTKRYLCSLCIDLGHKYDTRWGRVV